MEDWNLCLQNGNAESVIVVSGDSMINQNSIPTEILWVPPSLSKFAKA